jgi:hypothetical protein
MKIDFKMSFKLGTFKQKAHPILSIFVIACAIVTVGLLYILQKTEAAADTLNNTSYTQYLN